MPLIRNPEAVPGATMATAAPVNPALTALMRAEAERAAAERMLVQHVRELQARVAMLEGELARLSQCAVQQHWDGRLYLPSPRRLALSVVVNGVKFFVEAQATPLMEPPVRFGALEPEPPRRSGGSSALSPASLSALGGSATDWRGMAAANAIEDPRLPP